MINILADPHETIPHETVSCENDLGLLLYTNTQSDNYPPHRHQEMEIILPLEGSYVVSVDEERYYLEQDDILVVGASELHEIKAPADGKRLILQFDNRFLYSVIELESFMPFFKSCMHIKASESTGICEKLGNYMKEIASEYCYENILRRTVISALLIQFFSLASRTYLEGIITDLGKSKTNHPEQLDRFKSICYYIEEHCTEELSLDIMADKAGFSRYYFCRLFRETTGNTFYNYLNIQRIKKAQALLGDHTLTVTQIAMNCGFQSIPTFNRIFKSMKKCTPTEYRSYRRSGQH